jgi:Mce-associated membrane protein
MAVDDPAPTGELTDAESETAESPTAATDSASIDASADDAGEVAAAPSSTVRRALVVTVLIVVTIAGLCGWLGFRAYQSHQDQQRRALLLQVGRQGAVNLTTIDHQHAEADVQRILDNAAGTFHDDFVQRAQPFVDVVKRVQSTSVGTVTAAGLESESKTGAQILVAVSVKTSMPGSTAERPRAWRMRVTVEKVGDDTKVSNVEFVP